MKRSPTDTVVRYIVLWSAVLAIAFGTGYAIGDFGVLRAKSATDALLLAAGIGVTAFLVVALLATLVLIAAGLCIGWSVRDGLSRPGRGDGWPVKYDGQGRGTDA